jgi:hypothetical protein
VCVLISKFVLIFPITTGPTSYQKLHSREFVVNWRGMRSAWLIVPWEMGPASWVSFTLLIVYCSAAGLDQTYRKNEAAESNEGNRVDSPGLWLSIWRDGAVSRYRNKVPERSIHHKLDRYVPSTRKTQ